MISQLSGKYQFGAINTVDTTDGSRIGPFVHRIRESQSFIPCPPCPLSKGFQSWQNTVIISMGMTGVRLWLFQYYEGVRSKVVSFTRGFGVNFPEKRVRNTSMARES